MSNQINFLLDQALNYLRGGNLSGAELLLKQIIKVKPNHSEALRLYSVIFSKRGEHSSALEIIQKSILADRRNGIAYSNQGNVYLSLGMTSEAIASYEKAIKLTPGYAEAYSNLGNAFQNEYNYERAIYYYKQAIGIDSKNPDFKLNLASAFWRGQHHEEAIRIYEELLAHNPNYSEAKFQLSQIHLFQINFIAGWIGHEWRWHSPENFSKKLNTSKPLWQGQPFSGQMLIWAEQGIGDQILYASIFHELSRLPQKIMISVEGKLLQIFRRSFPDFEFVNKDQFIPEEQYDFHIPIGSIGKFYRNDVGDFKRAPEKYLKVNSSLKIDIKINELRNEKKLCGISWKSSNISIGKHKSISLGDLSEILNITCLEFINLQYGDLAEEVINIQSVNGVDLYEDLDYLLGIINLCDIVITTSNSTAHLSGALGKETLLLLPYSVGKFWYWHDIDGTSIWYPSIKIFKQEKQGDWSAPIRGVKAYLEKRFEI